jgi:hypothetical protein
MLRKLLSFGALVVVALALGAGPASAAKHPAPPKDGPGLSQDGFSDGRL